MIRRWCPRGMFIGLIALMSFTAHAQAPLWGDLKPGNYRVGFRSFWTSDSSRTFTYKFADGSQFGPRRAPRPVLVNVWYPASATGLPMTEANYLDFTVSGQSPLARFTRDLRRINEKVIANDVEGKALTELTKSDRAKLDTYLQAKVASTRDAKPASGKFPVAIYIQGNGSSLQDNSVLCEFLASNGYVVLGSAYQNEVGKMIADKETVCSDVRCLVNAAKSMRNADVGHIALIGHSAGAQTSIVYASQAGALVDAVISLDTTQDYYFNDKSGFLSYVHRVTVDNLKVPMLIAANKSAIFELADSMTKADRTYLTVDELGHDEYTSQGYGHALALKTENRDHVRQRYSALCQTELKFLNKHLKGLSNTIVAPPGFATVSVPVGSDGPPAYNEGSEPPTPRQFRVLITSDPQPRP